LTWDEKRNLYGTTVEGGIKVSNRCRFGCGTVFELSVNGKETVLFRFRVGTGKYPEGAVIRDAAGNLYGTAPRGGTRRGNSCCGLVFRVSSAGKETLLYKFTGGADGNNPSPNLLRDAAGNFYGTAEAGGQFISGTVFKLIP
jgi:uncharacterized repeat protein (TIGR03803 family)